MKTDPSFWAQPLGLLKARLPQAFEGFEQPEAEARHLLTHFLGLDPAYLALHRGEVLLPADRVRAAKAFASRLEGRPWGYIEGFVLFDGRRIDVGEECLIPREDSLPLLDALMPYVPQGAAICDWCTGSGVLGLTLAARRPDLTVTLVDADEGALRWARHNTHAWGLDERVEVLLGADERAVPHWKGHLFLANPPYIDDDEMARLPRDLRAEPVLALAGGKDGLDLYPFLIHYAASHLMPGGVLALEYGDALQGEKINALASGEGFTLLARTVDLSGGERGALWRFLL